MTNLSIENTILIVVKIELKYISKPINYNPRIWVQINMIIKYNILF